MIWRQAPLVPAAFSNKKEVRESRTSLKSLFKKMIKHNVR